MNKTYRVVWNESTNTWVAVAEIATARGKSSNGGVSVSSVAGGNAVFRFGFKMLAMSASIAGLYAATSGQAYAAPGIYINDAHDNGCTATYDKNTTSGIFSIDTDNGRAPLIAGGSTAQDAANLAAFGASSSFRPCTSVADPTFGVSSVSKAEARETQTNRTLFYGDNWNANEQDNGAKNLTLGGRLDVNSGIIGVGDRGVNGSGGTDSIRMGTGET